MLHFIKFNLVTKFKNYMNKSYKMNLTEKQLIRAIYSLWDFQQALSALDFLLEDPLCHRTCRL
jgi:hypothetical protein